MTAPTLYLWFPGTAGDALQTYQQIFGGEVILNTFADFSRTDGPAEAIAHGMLSGPVDLYATDVAGDDEPLSMTGVSIALLGTADGPTLTRWFDGLAEGGTVLDALQRRDWGAVDGQVIDRFGVRWLIGYELAEGERA